MGAYLQANARDEEFNQIKSFAGKPRSHITQLLQSPAYAENSGYASNPCLCQQTSVGASLQANDRDEEFNQVKSFAGKPSSHKTELLQSPACAANSGYANKPCLYQQTPVGSCLQASFYSFDLLFLWRIVGAGACQTLAPSRKQAFSLGQRTTLWHNIGRFSSSIQVQLWR